MALATYSVFAIDPVQQTASDRREETVLRGIMYELRHPQALEVYVQE